MKKDTITAKIEEALSYMDKARSILYGIKQQANDTLTDDNGKDIEREYNSVYNALANLDRARKGLRN